MRPFRRHLVLASAVAAGLASLALATAPGLRHHHAGGATHAHGHAHGHPHSHGHPHHHPHTHRSHTHQAEPGRLGWHTHVSLFGFEFTFWEPWADVEEAEPLAAVSKNATRGRPAFVVASPPTAGWISLIWIEAGPLPRRVVPPAGDGGTRSHLASIPFPLTRTDAPPVPPPEPA